MAYETCPNCGESKRRLVACPHCGFSRRPTAPTAADPQTTEACPNCGARKRHLMACPQCGFKRTPDPAPSVTTEPTDYSWSEPQPSQEKPTTKIVYKRRRRSPGTS